MSEQTATSKYNARIAEAAACFTAEEAEDEYLTKEACGDIADNWLREERWVHEYLWSIGIQASHDKIMADIIAKIG